MRPSARIGLLAACATPLVAAALGLGQAKKPADFAHDVLPILKARCVSCHDPKDPAGGLDLTTPAGAKKGGASGPLIVAGKPAQSLLIKMLKGTAEGKPQMPMGFAPLTAEDLSKIESWIASGGSFEGEAKKHWAYVPPARPLLPQVKNAKAVRNPIDAFVLAKLEKSGLKLSPEAPKNELLRRVSLDLIGLPPTLAELDAFLKDGAPGAYERAIDRLLASPHYGERQTRLWLDLARYADTNGFEADYSRVMWKWRDWVIDAYNRNLPFDRFTIEQIAGDLLPNPSLEQQIATGFHRNTMFNSEGGVDKDEAYFEVLVDRVNTTGTVWLGQTFSCARCHDHKYDPITQKDFYRLYAFWNNLEAKSEGDHNFGQDKLYEPTMDAPTPAQAAELKILKARLDEAETALKTATEESKAGVAAWVDEAKALTWTAPENPVLKAASGVPVKAEADGSFNPQGTIPAHDTYTFEARLPAGTWTGFRLEALPDPGNPKMGPGRAESGNFILSRLEVAADGIERPVAEYEASYVQEGYGTTGFHDQNGDTGWATWPQAGKRHVLVGAFKSPVAGPAAISVKMVMNSPTWPTHVLGRVRITATQAPDPVRFAFSDDVQTALAKNDEKTLAAFALKTIPAVRAARAERDKRKADHDALKGRIPTALVLKEKPVNGKPLTAPVRHRGEFLSPGDSVEAGTPAILNALPKGTRANRLALARWLVSPENPLTARVQVNRMWEQYFGQGLVETSDNFGTQGSKPTHPELLDWLATEFIRLKWDMKAMHRLIVTSATYRQSSNASPSLLAKDPKNELLARGPRFRLDAEAIRDNALAVSGLLDRKIGGPSVYPHQPDGIWNSPYNGERWNTSKGGDLYRRGLYTFWKRTSPYPSFMAFDAASREVCTARRERTNTPLQSLTLLNDPVFLESARALGKRMLAHGRPSHERPGDALQEGRVAFGFRLCTARWPTAAENSRLTKLANAARARYQKDPEAAKKLAGGVEEAVYTLVANTLLNLDETITKG